MYKILPHIEQEALYRQAINNAPGVHVDPMSGKLIEVMITATEVKLYYGTWATVVPAFLCPSDPRPLAELVTHFPGALQLKAPGGTLMGHDKLLGSFRPKFLGRFGRHFWELEFLRGRSANS